MPTNNDRAHARKIASGGVRYRLISGGQLRIARTNAGIAQEALAATVDCHKSLIGRWENQGTVPTEVAYTVADVLGVRYADLFAPANLGPGGKTRRSRVKDRAAFRRARRNAGLKQLELAAAVGAGETAIVALERTESVTQVLAERVADALGVPVTDLFEVEPPQ